MESLHNVPYASGKSVVQVIHRLRGKGLPAPLTTESLEKLSLASSMVPLAFRALQFLELIDEGGNHLPQCEQLLKASSEEYPGTLAEIVRTAYDEVFLHVDPAKEDFERVQDAFRGYQPSTQRLKMVRLFMALCEEAAIVPPQPKRHRVSKPSPARPRGGGRPPTPEPPPPPRRRYPLIDQVVAELPSEGKWSAERRDKWLQVITSTVDLVIDVEGAPRALLAEKAEASS